MTSTRLSLIALWPLAMLTACGASTPPAARAMYTADELNAFALPPPPEEVAGASDPTAAAPMMPAETPPPPASAHVRVIHASPDPAAATVAVYLDDAQTPAIASLAYKAGVGYADVPAAAHTVQVRPAAAAATTAPVLAGPTPALDGGASYTLIAHGVVGTPALALAAAPDVSPTPEAGHAHVRFFHALVGLGAVDVCAAGATALAPATALFTNVAYGAFGHTTGPGESYLNVPAGAATVQVRAHTAVACRGRVIGHVPLTLTEQGVSTVVAVGRIASVGHPAVASELVLCSDAPTASTTVCTVERVRPGAMPPAAPAAARPAAPAARPAAPAAH